MLVTESSLEMPGKAARVAEEEGIQDYASAGTDENAWVLERSERQR